MNILRTMHPHNPCFRPACVLAIMLSVLATGFGQDFTTKERIPVKTSTSSPSSILADEAASGQFNSDFTTPGLGAGARPGPGTQRTIDIPFPTSLEDIGDILASVIDATNPEGEIIATTSRSLVREGNPWTPVVGEFHYSRYPAAEWRDELLKMKSGGIDIVATSVFWIHHEEIEGVFDWNGDRDLRKFVETCADVGMHVIVHLGSWCRGEVRHGGLPDWVVASGWRLRSNDPRYMGKARVLFNEIGAQLRGLLWKDNGPVMGVQLECEYRGPAEHLLALKQMAVEAGIVVPLYTRTGWPTLTTPMPPGEIVPVYGVCAEGFGDREITSMPGNYWTGFNFSTLRVDDDIADDPDSAAHPYLASEIGGGMMSSYHRRILIDPRDIESIALVKLGSGSVMPGYRAYHGDVNPDAATPGVTLEETQSTRFTNWNDLPKKNHDSQAPLGLGGQARPHFHLLRRQHLFMHDFGHLFPGMPVVLPANRPSGKSDTATLRWAIRSNGRSGFIFVNNYQRLQPMPVHQGVQFALNLPPVESITPTPSKMNTTRSLTPSGAPPTSERRAALAEAVSKRLVPVVPVDIPADASFIWPFNLDLGSGAMLAYATAQLLCFVDTPDKKTRTYFFSEIPGIPPELAFDDTTVRLYLNTSGRHRKGDGLERITAVKTGRARAITLGPRDSRDKIIQIVVLSRADSLNLYKLNWGKNERVIISPHVVTVDNDNTLRVHAPTPVAASVHVYPPDQPASGDMTGSLAPLVGPIRNSFRETSSIFFEIPVPLSSDPKLAKIASPRVEKIRDPGPPREIPMGKAPKPVPAAPVAADFAAAAAWKIALPAGVWNHPTGPILRLRYTGDVARVLLDGKVILDDFYNGLPLDVPLARFAEKLNAGATLTVEILPLRKDAPILLPDSARPRFGSRASVVELRKAEIVQTFTHTLTLPSGDLVGGGGE